MDLGQLAIHIKDLSIHSNQVGKAESLTMKDAKVHQNDLSGKLPPNIVHKTSSPRKTPRKPKNGPHPGKNASSKSTFTNQDHQNDRSDKSPPKTVHKPASSPRKTPCKGKTVPHPGENAPSKLTFTNQFHQNDLSGKSPPNIVHKASSPRKPPCKDKHVPHPGENAPSRSSCTNQRSMTGAKPKRKTAPKISQSTTLSFTLSVTSVSEKKIGDRTKKH